MDEVKVREVVKVLNRIHEKDPTVLPALIRCRVPCNEALADDETVQVGRVEGGGWHVGILGIINGICGVNASDLGYIAAYFDKGRLVRFDWQDVPKRLGT